MKNLLERLAEYGLSSPAVKSVYEEQSVFSALLNLINETVSTYVELTAETCVELFAAMLKFNMDVFKDKLEQADAILESCAKVRRGGGVGDRALGAMGIGKSGWAIPLICVCVPLIDALCWFTFSADCIFRCLRFPLIAFSADCILPCLHFALFYFSPCFTFLL